MNINHVCYRYHKDSKSLILATKNRSDNFEGYLIRTQSSENKHDVGDFANNWVSTFEKYQESNITEEDIKTVKNIIQTQVSGEYAKAIADKLGIEVELEEHITKSNDTLIVRDKIAIRLSDIRYIKYDSQYVYIHTFDDREITFYLSIGFDKIAEIYAEYTPANKNKTIVK